MSIVSFADVVFESVSFSTEDPTENLILTLIDTPWVQRLREISQTANTRLVYMFSEHSRFGHSIGVSHLANILVKKLQDKLGDVVSAYRTPVVVAALLHDVGHLAPGSHTAFKTWYPGKPDSHEEIATRIIEKSKEIRSVLDSYDKDLWLKVNAILNEDSSVPPWTWEIISGGGWNVDRGNWCILDSVLAGVSYGKYNIPAIIDSLSLSDDGHILLQENRIDSMVHFAVSRHAMYRQIYHHRVLLAADTINTAIIRRARDLNTEVPFRDEWMDNALFADNPSDLSLDTIFHMRESWWRYHLHRWRNGKDETLKDLTSRLLDRKLFKTVRVLNDEDHKTLALKAKSILETRGLDPRYYLHEISMTDTHSGDVNQSLHVQMDDGSVRELAEADPIFRTLSQVQQRKWLCMPQEIKDELGRTR